MILPRVALAGGLLLSAMGCGQGPVHETARLAVVLDKTNDPNGMRSGVIARRYSSAPGTFTEEMSYATESTTEGLHSSRSSTTVVFDVAGDVDKIKADIAREPFVLSVTER